ncbi:MAG: sensor domain-containing diguanylate cyclase [Lachnospiraceae bacterium]|nr:sensor domain-containing diguanylate cyclase [Lachnospiraceae bacterium]
MGKQFLNKNKKVAVIAFIISFIILMILYAMLLQHEIKMEKDRYRYIAENEANNISTTIDCVMARTNTLKALLQDHGGDTDFFNEVAEDIYNSVKDETGVSLKNFAVAPDGIVSEVYPLEGNESLIGFDFLDTGRPGNKEAKEAYEQDATILTNPFELIQGGIGMGGRSPVILHNGSERMLWGLVTVTIDFDNLVEELHLENLTGMGIDYTLSYIDENKNATVMLSGGEPGPDAIRKIFNVRNLTWELVLQPSEGWINIWYCIFVSIVILIVSIFVGIFTYMMLCLQESNEKLIRISNTDQLSGCLNRRAYVTDVSELEKDDRINNDLVYVDIDVNGLKQVNDNKGHLAGDELVCGASECLRECLKPYGNVYRIGGDEFAAILYATEEEYARIPGEVQAAVDAWKGGSENKLSLSAGYASRREFPDKDLYELVMIADQRMYDAKREYYEKNGIKRRKA